MRTPFNRHLNAFGNRKLDGMRIPEREDDIFALHFSAITNANNIELFFEAFGDALDRIGDQSSRQSMQRPLRLALPRGDQLAVFLVEFNSARDGNAHFAFRALHVNRVFGDLDFHARGQRYWFSSNSVWPVMSPRGVERIATPMPPTTGRMALLPT
jgi:hypothetical protein